MPDLSFYNLQKQLPAPTDLRAGIAPKHPVIRGLRGTQSFRGHAYFPNGKIVVIKQAINTY